MGAVDTLALELLSVAALSFVFDASFMYASHFLSYFHTRKLWRVAPQTLSFCNLLVTHNGVVDERWPYIKISERGTLLGLISLILSTSSERVRRCM